MRRLLTATCLVLLAAGCAALDPAAVRDLTAQETEAFNALDQRLTANRSMIKNATENLGELGAEWAEEEFHLERYLAKAKRLEAMQAPWASARDEFAATQRAVVLYHLYEVDMVEQKILDARMAQRRAAAREVLRGYDRLTSLLGPASENLEIVLRHLDQPKSARIRAFTTNFLSEVTAFREGLQQSENPRVRALGEEVARHETAAVALKRQADQALQSLLSLQGRLDKGADSP